MKHRSEQEQSLLLVLPNYCLHDFQRCLSYVQLVASDVLLKISVGVGSSARSAVVQNFQEVQVEDTMCE